MNKERRKHLSVISRQLSDLLTALEEVESEESEYRDNIPENLQGSERYEKADEACDNLQSAIAAVEEALSYIDSAAE